MLSRLSICGGQSLVKSALKCQPVVVTAFPASQDIIKRNNSAASNHPPEYPPPGDKRDFVNFPRLVQPEYSPPVRLGFIPESWFKAFYPKTGYTGPYIFLFSTGTYMFSKEILVVEHAMLHLFGVITLCIYVQKKFGDKIYAFTNKQVEDSTKELDDFQESEKKGLKQALEDISVMDNFKPAITEYTKARTELVYMQMEAAYRQRLQTAYEKVKKRIDCMIELENVEKRMYQKVLVDYVLKNVMSSITPDLEKSAMQMCINDLNSLAAKA